MNKSLNPRFNRFLPFGLMALAAAVLLAPAAAFATPYVVTLTQQGSDVVATGSGAFDLAGLTHFGSSTSVTSIVPDLGYMSTGSLSAVNIDSYTGFTGPTNFGSGIGTPATTGSGDYVGIIGNSSYYSVPLLFVPTGYVSGDAWLGTATYDGASFASLGVIPGIYVWTWGTGADQSFTLDIVSPTAVPEPAALGVFGFGVLLVGAFVGLRRRTTA
ncbi:MAG: PEP-CTERM sorting domain-containing protein [Rhodanobacteraceae bacterium]